MFRLKKFPRFCTTEVFKIETELPALPYKYDALDPIIPTRIMELHHSKHHQGYINNYNIAMNIYNQAETKKDKVAMEKANKNIWFNGGGHVNHSIFWKNLCPVPEGGGNIDYAPNVMAEIKKKYKSFEIFKKEFNAITVGIHGSGWGWLIYSRKNKELEIKTTQNQEMVAFKHKGSLPLLGVDVWEHAYYLKYENRRNEYLENIWKVVNWKDVERRFMSRFNLSESD